MHEFINQREGAIDEHYNSKLASHNLASSDDVAKRVMALGGGSARQGLRQ